MKRKGLFGDQNYNDTSSELTDFAADGYAVSISDMSTNSDGTYSWTYTVAPSK